MALSFRCRSTINSSKRGLPSLIPCAAQVLTEVCQERLVFCGEILVRRYPNEGALEASLVLVDILDGQREFSLVHGLCSLPCGASDREEAPAARFELASPFGRQLSRLLG